VQQQQPQHSLLIDCHHGWILSGSRSKMRRQLTSDTPHHCWHHLLTHWASNHSCSSSLGLIHSPWSSWPTSSESWIHAHLHLTWWYSATWLLGPTGLSAAYICLSLIEEALWLWDRCLYKVALLRICHLLSHLLHAHSCNTLHILRSQVSFTVLFPLRNATYNGLDTMIRPFISVTAFVASSGEEKQTNPKPLLLPSSHITLAEVMVPNGVNSVLIFRHR